MRRIVLGIAAAVTTFAPAAVQADDQQIADFIRNKLQIEQREGNLRGFNVDLRVDRGTVWFDGNVSNSDQEALILRTAQSAGYLGVVQVVDDIEIAAPSPASPATNRAIPAIVPGPSAARTAALQTPLGVPARQPETATQVQYQQQRPAPTRFAQAGSGTRNFASAAQDYAAPIVTGEVYGAPADYGVPTEYGVPAGGEYVTGGEPMPFASCGGGGACAAPIEGVPVASGGGYGQPVSAGYGQPVPAGYGGGAGGPSAAPNLPGYAWPGYAANPNYGALTYPKQYSASAWPYIGPFYPYPQVPLGWRKVTLEWDDGWWQLDFNDH
jgi:hypothetical protein